MKRLLLILIVIFLLINSCASISEKHQDSDIEFTLDYLAEKWITSLISRDLDTYCDCYWPDAIQTVITADGTREQSTDLDNIREMQGYRFESDYPFESVTFLKPKKYFNTETGLPQYILNEEDRSTMTMFQFEERDGEWKIIDQWVFIRTFFDLPLPDDFQAWADDNHDEILDHGEQQILFEAFKNLITTPGPVGNSLDSLYDLNKDGFLEEREKEYAYKNLIGFGLQRFQNIDKEFTYNYLSNNNETRLNRHDIWFLEGFFYPDTDWIFPRPVSDFYDHKIDFNEDGFINQGEIDEYRELILRKTALLPRPVFLVDELEGTIDEVFEWTDSNENGDIDDFELDDLQYEIFLQFLNDWGAVFTPIQSFFDENRDYILDETEHLRLFDYFMNRCAPVIFADDPDYASRYIDYNENGFLEPQEKQTLLDYIQYSANREENSPVVRELDRRFDLNESGFIEWEEKEQIEQILFFKLGRIWLESKDIGIEESLFETSNINYSLEEGRISLNGKKVALLGIFTQLKNVDPNTLEGMRMLIENALVNTNTVKVMERHDMDAIFSEFNFQTNAMIDDQTALEIGKLSGANSVALGKLTKMAEQFFLNFKLIDVQSGEIIGSSMISGTAESDFPIMCVESVNSIFTHRFIPER